ncbi:MAG TPA: sigma factor-like helix-turn-helix DNA-binding protein, partial [Tepidisphaeraceae bacterium]|nr:sigma factor-like helix-turn-helix DNA-binding protein [Tepidisphaeraceae bacterium]
MQQLIGEPTGMRVVRRVEVGREMLKYAKEMGEEDRLVLELFFRRGMTRREIGQVMGVDGGTVSRRIRRLAVRLREPVVVAVMEA